jgi:hypothetical protein
MPRLSTGTACVIGELVAPNCQVSDCCHTVTPLLGGSAVTGTAAVQGYYHFEQLLELLRLRRSAVSEPAQKAAAATLLQTVGCSMAHVPKLPTTDMSAGAVPVPTVLTMQVCTSPAWQPYFLVPFSNTPSL